MQLVRLRLYATRRLQPAVKAMKGARNSLDLTTPHDMMSIIRNPPTTSAPLPLSPPSASPTVKPVVQDQPSSNEVIHPLKAARPRACSFAASFVRSFVPPISPHARQRKRGPLDPRLDGWTDGRIFPSLTTANELNCPPSRLRPRTNPTFPWHMHRSMTAISEQSKLLSRPTLVP